MAVVCRAEYRIRNKLVLLEPIPMLGLWAEHRNRLVGRAVGGSEHPAHCFAARFVLQRALLAIAHCQCSRASCLLAVGVWHLKLGRQTRVSHDTCL